MSFWCLHFLPKTNENKSTSSKVEFVRLFFGRKNVSLKKSFQICLTFMTCQQHKTDRPIVNCCFIINFRNKQINYPWDSNICQLFNWISTKLPLKKISWQNLFISSKEALLNKIKLSDPCKLSTNTPGKLHDTAISTTADRH